MSDESKVTGKHFGMIINDGENSFINGTDIVIKNEFQFPENCYQKLKQSEDIFDRVAAAFLILRLKSRGESVPGEEVDFAYNTLNEHRLSTMQKGGAF